MANTTTKIVFGGGVFNATSGFPTPEEVEKVLKVLEEEGVKVIDTAQAYGTSEELLGQTGAASRFIIDTKYPGGLFPTEATKEIVIASGEESLKKLKTDSVSNSKWVLSENAVSNSQNHRWISSTFTHQIAKTHSKKSLLVSTNSTSPGHSKDLASPTSAPTKSKT